jgi:enediyne biosynthesis protein E4
MGYVAGVAVGEHGNEQASMGVVLGDYLHTGRLAFFVTNFAEEYDALYRHDAPLMYTDVSFPSGIARVMGPYVGWGTAFFDYDNDGWPDLMVVNGHVYPQVDNVETGTRYAQRILLFHNQGNGTFAEVAATKGKALMAPRVSRGAAFGDLDNDGDIDVVINNLDGKPTILRNDGGNRNNWITIRTAGKGLNRDALGAKVKVVSGDLVEWDHVRSGGSYLSSSDLRLHYGLGKRTRVDLIEIHRPDGQTEKVQNVSANQFVTVQEGRGVIRLIPRARH